MDKSLNLLVILASSTVLSHSIDKDFIYLGSFKSDASTREPRNGDFDENFYYFSVHPNTWAIATEDCKKIFGNSNTLVAIESVEEWEFLKHKLEKYGGTVYWTSGIYDPPTSSWRWAANNQPLAPFAPWGRGFPNNPNEIFRVLVNVTNRYDASWATADLYKTHRYICEVQKATTPVPCHATADLIIVLDSSENIGFANFQKTEDFVNKLVRAFTVLKENRIAMITYSTTATTIIDITNNFTPAEISSIILSTVYEAGSTTYTNLGIDLAMAQLNSSPRKVPLIMVVLTSGTSDKPSETISSATNATKMGIRSFSVGITHSVDMAELIAIAGGNSSRVFNSVNFDKLIELLAPISIAICP